MKVKVRSTSITYINLAKTYVDIRNHSIPHAIMSVRSSRDSIAK